VSIKQKQQIETVTEVNFTLQQFTAQFQK